MRLIQSFIIIGLTTMFTSVPCFGSIGTILPCREGLILTADKRGCFLDEKGEIMSQSDDFVKWRKLNDHCLFGLFGMAVESFLDDTGQRRTLNFFDEIQEYFDRKPSLVSVLDRLEMQGLIEYVRDKMTVFLQKKPASTWLNKWTRVGDTKCSIALCNYNRLNHQFEFVNLDIKLDPTLGKVDVTANWDPTIFDLAGMVVIGHQDQIVDEVRNDLHSTATCHKFVQRKKCPKIQDISAREAIEASLQMVKLAHERFPKLIGETADVFILNADGVKQVSSGLKIHDANQERGQPTKVDTPSNRS